MLHARGIRYARAARFAAPQPIAPWSDILEATGRGPVCPQLPSRLEWVTGPVVDGLAMSEDCQVISVTAPSDAHGLPVMVWFHGGAYLSGGGEAPKYDADELARRGRVVVVRVSYRLGVLGYLSPSGVDNLGLRDQICALQWVHDNIGTFGGDPDRVTIFGQSAGADSVFSLMLAIASNCRCCSTRPRGPMRRCSAAIPSTSDWPRPCAATGAASLTAASADSIRRRCVSASAVPPNVGYPHAFRRNSVTQAHARAEGLVCGYCPYSRRD